MPVDTAADLASQLNGWDGGGGGGGSLTAAADGDTVTVTGTAKSAAGSDAGSILTLNIGADVTVIWKANVDFSAYTGSTAPLILKGTGTFELATGGVIKSSISGASRVVTVGAASGESVTMKVTGGTVENTSAATNKSAVTVSYGRLEISGGAIKSTGTGVYLNPPGTGVRDDLFEMSGGEMSSSGGNALSTNLFNTSVVVISGGTIKTTSSTSTHYAVSHSGGTVIILGGTLTCKAGSGISALSIYGLGVFWSKGSTSVFDAGNDNELTAIGSAENKMAVWYKQKATNKSGIKYVYGANISGFYEVGGVTVNLSEIDVKGVEAIDRVYDGTTSVELTGGYISGANAAFNVGFDLGSGTMADANVGTDKPVTTNVTLTGDYADQYFTTQPADVKVTITAKSISDVTATQSGTLTYTGAQQNAAFEVNTPSANMYPSGKTAVNS